MATEQTGARRVDSRRAASAPAACQSNPCPSAQGFGEQPGDRSRSRGIAAGAFRYICRKKYWDSRAQSQNRHDRKVQINSGFISKLPIALSRDLILDRSPSDFSARQRFQCREPGIPLNSPAKCRKTWLSLPPAATCPSA